jgi:hypothetical protein
LHGLPVYIKKKFGHQHPASETFKVEKTALRSYHGLKPLMRVQRMVTAGTSPDYSSAEVFIP